MSDYTRFTIEIERRMKELERAHLKGDYYKTICYLRYLSHICYYINYKMRNDRLETITQEVSLKYLGKTCMNHVNDNNVVFYDSYGVADRVLANIYVKALDKLNYKITWIMYDYLPDVKKIQKQFEDRKNITFYIVPKKTILERMEIIRDVIKEISPKHILMHTRPDDIGGLGAISTISGMVTRYLIDVADHVFWIGKCAADYIIGYRNYGYNIAVQYRGIPSERVKILPYYPDKREQYPYEGMPFDTEKYDFVFSGGSSFKIEGSEIYKEMVECILNKYSELRFVYAANHSSPTLEELKNEFPGRFYYIAERRDLDEVLKHAKFFLGTYPIGGGLMTQYALLNRCIPLCLCDLENENDNPKTWLLKPEDIHFIFYNKEDLLQEVDRIMNDEDYYKKEKAGLEGHVISEEEFVSQLKQLLDNKATKFTSEYQDINFEGFLDIYRRRATYEKYCNIIYGSRNQWVHKKHPFIVRRQRQLEKTKTILGEGKQK